MKLLLVISFFLIQISSYAIIIAPNLTGIYDPIRKIVKLNWQNNDDHIMSFVLQRSADNLKWIDLHEIRQPELNKNRIEKYTDAHPDPNQNFYRLKIINNESEFEFSASISVIIGNDKSSWTMYPVPVNTVLNLQYSGSDVIPGVVTVIIQNSKGTILARLRTSSLARTIQIPVSNFGRGLYDARILIMDKVVWQQRFVK